MFPDLIGETSFSFGSQDLYILAVNFNDIYRD